MLTLSDLNSTDTPIARPERRRGATAMEYLMMISLVVVVCLVAIGFLAGKNQANMANSSNLINKSLKKGS